MELGPGPGGMVAAGAGDRRGRATLGGEVPSCGRGRCVGQGSVWWVVGDRSGPTGGGTVALRGGSGGSRRQRGRGGGDGW